MPAISPAFIRAIPKTDLHLHLDGSLRIDTLFELAKAAGVDVPGDTPEALRATVFKDKYASLEEYLRGFGLTTAAMQTEAGLFRVAYELMIDNAAEGVRYIEARFAPQLLMSDKLSFHQVMAAVDSGLRQARDELNARRTDGEPEYDYGLIVCAMRFFTPEFSPYYRQFAHQHRTLPALEIRRLAALELAHAATELRASSDIQIVGFDIAGAENGFPAADFAEAYDLAGQGFLDKTVHAGEAYGAESIYQAVTKTHASRLGHGLRLFDADKLQHVPTEQRATYLANLLNVIAQHQITIEVCLTSNLQTTPDIASLDRHPLGQMIANGLSVTLCTDNRLVSSTTVCREYELAVGQFAIDAATLRHIALTGFRRAFHYRPYAAKRTYLAQVAAYYDQLAQQHGVA